MTALKRSRCERVEEEVRIYVGGPQAPIEHRGLVSQDTDGRTAIDVLLHLFDGRQRV